MEKKTGIILGLSVLVAVVAIIAFWPSKKQIPVKIEEPRVVVPTRQVINNDSGTGAKEISLSDQQYDEVYLIKNFRNRCPLDRENFRVDFDYKINKFVVIYKNENGVTDFNKWLEESGYSKISTQYFQVNK